MVLLDIIAPISPSDMEKMVEEYVRIVSKIIAKHASLKERVVNVRTRSPWMTTGIIEEKKRKRKYERKWRVSKLTEDRKRKNIINY